MSVLSIVLSLICKCFFVSERKLYRTACKQSIDQTLVSMISRDAHLATSMRSVKFYFVTFCFVFVSFLLFVLFVLFCFNFSDLYFIFVVLFFVLFCLFLFVFVFVRKSEDYLARKQF